MATPAAISNTWWCRLLVGWLLAHAAHSVGVCVRLLLNRALLRPQQSGLQARPGAVQYMDLSSTKPLVTNTGVIYMSMSPIEKMIIAAVAPLVVAEVGPILKPILDKALVSASPEIQAAEKDLEAFILAILPDVLGALVADAAKI